VDGRGEIHGYLTPREITRAVVAKWWGTTPPALRHIPLREFRAMTEFMDRANKAHADAVEAAKSGLPTPGRSTSPTADSW
jgi:hypothetical protein